MNKYISLSLLACLMVLVACNPQDTTNNQPRRKVEEIASRLVPLNPESKGQRLLDPQNPENCSVNDFEMPGQGWHIGDSVGGISLVDGTLLDPSEAVKPELVAEQLAKLAELDIAEQSVALIVLDDFGGNSTTGVPSVFQLAPDAFFLPTSPLSGSTDQQLADLQGQIDVIEAAQGLSHGALVMNHILALINATGELHADFSSLKRSGVVEFKSLDTDGVRLVVLGVDTEGGETGRIAPELMVALERVFDTKDIRKAVVNMSFAIVPCSILEDFEAVKDEYQDFSAYAEALKDANKGLQGGYNSSEFLNIIQSILSTPFDGDPLVNAIEEQAAWAADVLYVASAGNYSLPYSMFLGALPRVVSVSSFDIDAPASLSVFSNYGEVVHSGAWFNLVDATGLLGVGSSQVAYAGTSFSAPDVSTFSAFDYLKTRERCGLRPNNLPEIAQLNASNRDIFINKTLKDAVAACIP